MDSIDLIQEGKIKRFFRARRKLDVPNLIYHITQRATGSEPLFLEKSDYLAMLALMKDVAQDRHLMVYAFCLMPNHIHLLVSPKEANLSICMRDLFSRYAMIFNKKYERKGSLFAGRYRQAVCLDDSYLLTASLYIHLNPVRAALTRTPQGYRWSSVRLYWEDDSPESFVKPDFILSLFSGKPAERCAQYRALLRKGAGLKTGEVAENKDAIEVFHSRLISLFPAVFGKINKRIKTAEALGAQLATMQDLEREIERLRRGPYPNRPETRKAKRYLIEQLISRGYTRTEISQRLGISRKTIYNILHSHLK
ncbi:MAG: transposase [Desulfobacteraceae bacterium]|jgi:putative transposase